MKKFVDMITIITLVANIVIKYFLDLNDKIDLVVSIMFLICAIVYIVVTMLTLKKAKKTQGTQEKETQGDETQRDGSSVFDD